MKRAAWQGFISLTAQGLGAISGYLALRIILHYADMSVYGQYQYALALVSIIAIITNFGLDKSHIHFISNRADQRATNIATYTKLRLLATALNIFIFIVIVTGWYYLANQERIDTNPTLLGLVLTLTVIDQVRLIITNTWMGEQQVLKKQGLAILEYLLNVILLIAIITKNPNAAYIAIAYITSKIITTTVAAILWKKENREKAPAEKENIKEYLKYGKYLWLLAIIGNLWHHIDTILIGYLLTTEEVALYVGGLKLANIALLPILALGGLILAKYSTKIQPRHHYGEIAIITLSIVAGIILSLAAPPLMPWLLGTEFTPINTLIPILALWSVANTAYVVITTYYISQKHSTLIIPVTMTALAINLILDIILIPKYGIHGAAWASAISMLGAVVLLELIYHKNIKKRHPKVFKE